MIQMTYRELQDMMYNDIGDIVFDRFKVIWNAIPREGNPNDYLEDDGRQLRYFEAVDTLAGEEISFSYVFHHDYLEFPICFLGNPPDNIEFVPVSVINPPKPVIPEPPKPKTPEQIADEIVCAPYRSLEAQGELKEFQKGMVPKKIVTELKKWLKETKGQPTTIYDLRAKVFPVCAQYKVTERSFWQYLQGWTKK